MATLNKMVFARQADHEFQVELESGTAYVYADCWVHLGDLYQFYHGDVVVQEFEDCKVVDIVKVW